jgi:hypothetical protein
MSYNNLSIGKWINLQEYLKIEDLLLSKMKIVEELTGENVEALTLDAMMRKYNDATAFFSEELPTEWQRIVKIKGEEFKPRYTFSEWNAGQFISFQSLINEGLNAMPMVMAIMLKKKGDKVLNEAELLERAEWLRDNMSIAQAYPLYIFFSIVTIVLPTVIKASSTTKERAKVTLLKLSGVGTLSWKALRKGMLPDFKTYWKLMYLHS